MLEALLTLSRMSMVSWDTWILMGRPVDSIRPATSTVSLGGSLSLHVGPTHPNTL